MDSVLIDTNLLVYLHDPSEPEKRQRATQVLQRLQASGSGVLSAQTLSEFYNAVTRKLKPPLTPEQAEQQVQRLARAWPVFSVTPQVVLEAARGARAYQFHFWDAQIWAVARLNGISLVLSEDFNPGAVVEGVCFVNPLTADFDLTAVGL